MPEAYKRWIACGDNHGDMIDPVAKRAFFDFLKWFKPQIRVHLGDCFDFRALRRGAGDEEKREPVREDVDAGLDFLAKMQPTAFLRGNHDERLWDFAINSRNAFLQDFCAGYASEISKAVNCPMLPYDKRKGVYQIGRLKVIHGYNTGIYAARMAAQAYGSCIMGHVHAVDSFSIPGIEPREGRAIGCLCKLDMDYNRAQLNTLRQGHGFAYGLVFPNGNYSIWQAREIDGAWVFPSEFKVWRATA